MTIKTEFLDLVREETELNLQQCSDALLMTYLNQVRDDIFSFASTFNGNHFTWNYWITDLIAWQAEYTMAENAQDTKYDMKKILSVYRKNEHNEWNKLKSYDLEALPHSLSELEQDWPDFYFRADTNSIFLYPIPLKTIKDGLKVVGSYLPKVVNAEDTMDALLIPREYQTLLWVGLTVKIYQYKKQYDERNLALQNYENEKLKFKATSGEMQQLYYANATDLSEFE